MSAYTQTIAVKPATEPVHKKDGIKSIGPTSKGQKLGETPIKEALGIAALYRARDGIKGMSAILTNYAVIASCIAFDQAVSKSGVSPGFATAAYIGSVFVIASRLRAFENLVHEASHNNLFAAGDLHEPLQFLYAFPVFRLLRDYRHSHSMHHKYLGDPKRDPDVQRLLELGLDKLPERPLWFLFGLPMTGYLIYEYMTTTFRDFWLSPSSYKSKVAYWTTLTLTILYTGTLWEFTCYYLVPFLVVLTVTRYWAEASEHLGLDLTKDFGNSRSNIGFLHRWYMHPHNDGYHAVHHLHSQVPFYLLPDAHHHLMKESAEFKKKTVVSHGMIETFRQMAMKRMIIKSTGETLEH